MAHIKIILNTETGEIEVEGSSKVESHLEEIIDSLEELGFSEDAAHSLIANNIAEKLEEYEKEIYTDVEEYDEDEDEILLVTKYTVDSESIIEALDEILEEFEEIIDEDSDEDEEDE